MSKKVSASDAKNNFGGLLEDVAALGIVEIMKHGRLVAVVLSPRAFNAAVDARSDGAGSSQWGEKHMISPDRARAAKMIGVADGFDED
jgi:prevent-host-death family protein